MEQTADRQQTIVQAEEEDEDDLWDFDDKDNEEAADGGSDSDSSGSEVLGHLPAAKRRKLQKTLLAMPHPITLSSSDEEDNGNNSDLDLLKEEVKASTEASTNDDDLFALPLQRLPSQLSERQSETMALVKRNRDMLEAFKRSSEVDMNAFTQDVEQEESEPEASQHSSPQDSEPETVPDAVPEASKIMLKLRSKKGQEVKMRIEPSNPFSKLFDIYKAKALEMGWAGEDAKFCYMFDGDVLKGEDTPAEVDVEDDCVIEVHW